MSLLKTLFGGSEPHAKMTLEAESGVPIQNPTDEEVRGLVLRLRNDGPSFASLTDLHGNYVQVAGGRPWCVVERRQINPITHERAFQQTPVPKYNDGAKLSTGAGDITLNHDEWFLQKDAAEIFCAFLNGEPFPPKVQWRSLNEMLGI